MDITIEMQHLLWMRWTDARRALDRWLADPRGDDRRGMEIMGRCVAAAEAYRRCREAARRARRDQRNGRARAIGGMAQHRR